MSVEEWKAQIKRKDLLIESCGFIDGEWASAKNGATFEVFEPSTEQVFGKAANYDRDDIQRAIKSAVKAGREYYKTTTATDRSVLLRKWNDAILANKDDLATILCLENGKTLVEAKSEIEYAASFVLWFSEEAKRTYGDTIPSSTARTTILTWKQPVGTCAVITPFNFPAAMITRKVAPALAVGCAVVIKPPTECPFTSLALTKLAVEVGIPAGLLQVAPTKDREAAMELATNPLIKKLSFTGATGVGKLLTKLAAGTMKRVSMELGGNAAFIVFEDADIDLAVDSAMFCKFRCAGQACVGANRFLVHKSIAKAFTEKLVARVSGLKMGPGMDPSTTLGPLVNSVAVRKVKEHVYDACRLGAKIEIGGGTPDGPGFFHEPTVISSTPLNAAVFREETFGPLAAIFEFATEEDALRIANATESGLAGYFFSNDVRTVLRVAATLEVGMVGINTGNISAVEAPSGGIKESGVGREGSMYGLDDYQVIKTITIGNCS